MDWKDELYAYKGKLDELSFMYEHVDFVLFKFGIMEAKMGAHFDFREPLLAVYVACHKLGIEFPIFECLPQGRKEEMFNWIIKKSSLRKDWYTRFSVIDILNTADSFFVQETNHARDHRRESIEFLNRMKALPDFIKP